MNRAAAMEAIANEGSPWDVVVIGGGASGFGAAVDAASRGFRTLLLEQHDFGKCTSSRSTKLVHGGVRYLQQGRLGLVRESLYERGILLRNAPHVTQTSPFIVPTYDPIDTAFYAAGLKFYDMLSGRLSLGRSEVLNRQAVVDALPTVATNKLRGGIRYLDGQFDDARLIIVLAQTLFDLGGIAVNYVPVVQILKSNRRVAGVEVRDAETGREFKVRARAVINATGAFADAVRRLDQSGCTPMVTLSQGAHVVVDRSFLPGAAALMIPKTTDGRVLFAIPWQEHVLIGTTDRPATEATLEPRPVGEDIAFILENAARYLVRPPTRADILSSFAGLRPLAAAMNVKRTADISRGYTLAVSESGLVTLTGGKWTTYRKMGETAVDKAIAVAGLEQRPARTRELRLHGGGGLPPVSYAKHWRIYGSDAAGVSAIINERLAWREPLHPALPYLKGEVIWAARQEMARTVEDVLARRMRILFFNARAACEAAASTADLLAHELGKDEPWRRAQVAEFLRTAEQYRA